MSRSIVQASPSGGERAPHIVFLTVCVLLGGACFGSAVQAQETQVPIDEDSTLYTVDRELRDELGLFPDVVNFQEALLYRLEEGQYELVLRYRENGALRRERRSLPWKEVQALRSRVTEHVSPRQETRTFTHEGRYDLIASTTVHGLVQGSLVTGALGIEGSRMVAFPLLGAGVGFFVPLFATQNARVTDAEADMAFYGGLQGYGHAVHLSYLLGDDVLSGRATAGLAAVVGAGEGVAAYRLARRNNWTAGHAEIVSYTGLAGNIVGLGVSGVLFDRIERRPDGISQSAAGASLLGSLAGVYVGHRMGRTDRYSKGDARVYLLSAVQMVNLAGSFLSLDDERSLRLSSAVLTGSVIGGGLIGRQLVQDREFTPMDGNLIGLGSGAGSLLGLAITVEAASGRTRGIAQSLGSLAGFGLTYSLLTDEARRRAAKSTSAFNWNVHMSPRIATGPDATDRMSVVETVRPRVSVTASF